MQLFNKGLPAKEVEKITPKIAQEVYELFQKGNSETPMFLENNIPFTVSTVVKSEIRYIESRAMSLMSENLYKSFKELVDEIESELLEVEVVISDIVQYHPYYTEKGREWSEFRDSFKKELE